MVLSLVEESGLRSWERGEAFSSTSQNIIIIIIAHGIQVGSQWTSPKLLCNIAQINNTLFIVLRIIIAYIVASRDFAP
jgi:hypothetical protein